MKFLGLLYPDPYVHDNQHFLASIGGLVLGACVFLTYYFMSRIEAEYKGFPWLMPWYYYVVGIILFAFTFSALACVLSAAIRKR